MIVERRRIERLCLRAPRAADVPGIANTLQQALRLASLPGDGHPGRLYVRRLELPALRLGTGPQAIAQWLGARMRELRSAALPISHRRAATANAVIARDPVEAMVLALVRSAVERRRLTEWFWPHVDPQLRADRPASHVAAASWRLLAARADAPLVVPAVVGTLLDIDADGVAWSTIDAVLAEALGHAIGGPLVAASSTGAALDEVIPPRWAPVLRRVTHAWGDDSRTAFLVTAASRAALPRRSSATVAALVERAHRRAAWRSAPTMATADVESPRSLEREPTPTRRQQDPPQDPASATVPAPPALPGAAPPVAEPTPSLPRRDPAARPEAVAPDVRPPRIEATDPPAPVRWTLAERPQPTAHGGLYFLLRPLAQLGLPEVIAGDETFARAELGIRVLEHIADALSIPPDDPIRVPLRSSRHDPAAAVPPLPRQDGSDDELVAWHDATQAWLQRNGELDLATVVRRPASVMCSRTHVDVVFDMESSDVRIRRAGLDIDPGWVRWLGRVVAFHYVYGGRLDA